MKKILILTITAGMGHNTTAKAIQDALTNKGVASEIVDVYEYISPVLRKTVNKGYLLSTSMIPVTYGRAYRLAEWSTDRKDSMGSFVNITNSVFSIKFRKFIDAYDPDVIVCTHIFAAQLVCLMKYKGLLDTKIVGVMTDYTIHPFWTGVKEELDYLITASEFINNQARRKGFPAEMIRPLGIPVNPKFALREQKDEAREKLGIAKDKFTVLMMGGSMGHGRMAANIKRLNAMKEDFQIIAVCGNNESMEARLSRLHSRKPLYVYGYVNNVDEMMDAADCIITKPGGLTSTEAIAKELPMIMTDPIPGQEERNVEFFLNMGMALMISNTFTVDDALYELMYSKSRFDMIQESIRIVGKPDCHQ